MNKMWICIKRKVCLKITQPLLVSFVTFEVSQEQFFLVHFQSIAEAINQILEKKKTMAFRSLLIVTFLQKKKREKARLSLWL